MHHQTGVSKVTLLQHFVGYGESDAALPITTGDYRIPSSPVPYKLAFMIFLAEFFEITALGTCEEQPWYIRAELTLASFGRFKHSEATKKADNSCLQWLWLNRCYLLVLFRKSILENLLLLVLLTKLRFLLFLSRFVLRFVLLVSTDRF